jgi:hypothetical protein
MKLHFLQEEEWFFTLFKEKVFKGLPGKRGRIIRGGCGKRRRNLLIRVFR